MKYYNLSNDYLLKKIFTKEKYLKQLLFDLFEVKIDTIEYLNVELLKTNKIYREILKEIKNYNIESEEREKMDDIARMIMEEKEYYINAYIDGKEEGISQGISQGLSQGISQGIILRNSEIAKNMLEENVDINLISKVTNLSVNEINQLK